jgi:hypothetical protein
LASRPTISSCYVEEVGQGLVEALGPKMIAAHGVDELNIDAHAISAGLDAAFEHVADFEFASNLSEIGRFAFVGKGG